MPDISESIPINEFNRQVHFDKALIDPPYDVPCTVAGSFHLKNADTLSQLIQKPEYRLQHLFFWSFRLHMSMPFKAGK